MCGAAHSEENPLQVHHMVAIWFARNCTVLAPYFPELIKSVLNAIVLCEDCHTQVHHQESDLEYSLLAETLINRYRSAVLAAPVMVTWQQSNSAQHLTA